MKFSIPAMESHPPGQQYRVYQPESSSSSSTYTYFTEQAIRAGFPSGSFGGGHRGPEMFRGRLEMREAIQRELEKEIIREKIIAEEIARKRIWEAEMMAMKSGDGGGFPSPFMPLAPPPSHNNLLNPRQNSGFDIVPFQRFAYSPTIKRSYHSG